MVFLKKSISEEKRFIPSIEYSNTKMPIRSMVLTITTNYHPAKQISKPTFF